MLSGLFLAVFDFVDDLFGDFFDIPDYFIVFETDYLNTEVFQCGSTV